jgi:hypothetical protein
VKRGEPLDESDRSLAAALQGRLSGLYHELTSAH